MGGTARFGSHLPEKSDCRIRQFARTDKHALHIFDLVEVALSCQAPISFKFLLFEIKHFHTCQHLKLQNQNTPSERVQ